MQLIFLDTETTDLEPSRRLVQLAFKDRASGSIVNEFFKPPVPISVGSMAVHHITNEMVNGRPVFVGSGAAAALHAAIEGGAVIVAHNTPFDIGVLKNEGIEVGPYIDTCRVARHLIQSDQYALQYLRYLLKLPAVGAAHDALGDITILESLYDHLCARACEKFSLSSDVHAVAEKLRELTATPVLLTTVNFGKYRGKTFADVCASDRDYLVWLRGSEMQKPPAERSEELVFTLNHYCQV